MTSAIAPSKHPQYQPGQPHSRWRFICGLAIGLALAAILSLSWTGWYVWRQLPDIETLDAYKAAEPLRIYAADGELLAQYGPERREVLAMDQIPAVVRDALLAIEDARYYEHGAVDFAGVARAALSNVLAGRQGQGGSTITMQVARNFYLTNEKTWIRKFAEIMLAYKLEARYDKDRVLELYMNEIYLGERAYGFAAAAGIYFNKSLDELTIAEAALLAGLPKAPSAYNPMINPVRAQQRQHYILGRMLALAKIDATEYRLACAEPLVLAARGNSGVREAAYAVEQARQWALERYGDDAYKIGINLHLTLDMPKQRAADAALRDILIDMQNSRGYQGPEARAALPEGSPRSKAIRRILAAHPDSGELRAGVITTAGAHGIDVALADGSLVRMRQNDIGLAGHALNAAQRRLMSEGAVIRLRQSGQGHWQLAQLPLMEGAVASLDVDSGAIIALVGGFDYQRNKYDHATLAYRQPGSAFKPFLYSAALEKGYFPGTLVDDRQRVLGREETHANPWKPRNFNEHYEGFITVRHAFAKSKNMVAVGLMQASGAKYVQQFAVNFGFDPARNPASLPLALGAGAITPLQLTAAFSVFASGGWHRPPYLVARVSDRQGRTVFDGTAAAASSAQRAISARNAWLTDSLLRSVVSDGSGRSALSLGRSDLAGKTGTSNRAFDAWFGGYGGGIATTVWVGYDRPRSLGNRSGAIYALPIWKRYMAEALRDRPEQLPAMPQGIVHDGNDYVYVEYLQGQCVPDSYRFIDSAYRCAAGRNTVLADGTSSPAQVLPSAGTQADASEGVLTAQVAPPDQTERARIIEFFSTVE